MPLIDLDRINPNGIYDADETAAIFHIHRTSVHRQIFSKVVTQRIGRKETATGAELIRHARGQAGTAA